MVAKNMLWVIDDDPALRLILEDTFNDAGLEVRVFSNAKGAWATLNDVLNDHESIDILPQAILTDIRMPMMDGLSFSDWVHSNFPELPIIIMTAHSDLKSAVDSYQTGAFDYLPKPFDLDDAITIINKAINQAVNKKVSAPIKETDKAQSTPTKTKAKKSSSANPTSSTPTKDKPSAKPAIPSKVSADISSGIIGQSAAMQTVFRAIGRLSNSPITVLITGESGTGKELVANALHKHSPRHNKAFIALNMAALPHDLIESELFGHEKGAFTGATTQRQGRFEQADGGTLFLDEIGDMPFSTQTRLLRVLANGEFFRVGGQKPIKVDVRIVAATHQNLEALVKQGKFREDLFYRLNVIRLPLPSLRERRDDIPALVEFFMQRTAVELNSETNSVPKILSPEAMQMMQAFDWSGNVRQLENVCRWITVMAIGDTVLVEDLPPELTQFAQQQALNNRPLDLPQQTITHSPLPENEGYQDSVTTQNDFDLRLSDPNAVTQRSVPPVYTSANPKPLNTEPTAATHPLPTPLTWQQQLQVWADKALETQDPDVLQTIIPEFEQVLINIALKHTKGRKGEAAELLGWGRNTLTRKLKQLANDTKD